VTNSEAIQRAIAKYLDHEGETVVTLAEKLAVSHPTVVRWRNGETRVIRAQHWAKLRLLLTPYLEADPFEIREPASPYGSPPAPRSLRDIPVLDLAQVATYQPALEPLADWYGRAGQRTEPWSPCPAGDHPLCIDLGAEALAPEFPPGTRLLVAAGEYAQSGDLVLARLASHRGALVARYEAREDGLSLLPVGTGEPIRIDPQADPGRLVWAWPVLQARIDYR
jgi:hypothetical protein